MLYSSTSGWFLGSLIGPVPGATGTFNVPVLRYPGLWTYFVFRLYPIGAGFLASLIGPVTGATGAFNVLGLRYPGQWGSKLVCGSGVHPGRWVRDWCVALGRNPGPTPRGQENQLAQNKIGQSKTG